MVNKKNRNIVILGSTGSIGTQALEIIRDIPDKFVVTALSGNSNYQLLAKQANEFKPDYVLLCDENNSNEFRKLLTYKPKEIIFGNGHLDKLAVLPEADIILNALVGFAGFTSTYQALNAGKRVALANKESLVTGGELIAVASPDFRERLIPIDSEHSAMFQCLLGEPLDSIRKIIITASGGPFRAWSSEQMEKITVEDALKHPNWDMGSKITIDSATMMNKGLEIIEAHWLFGLPAEAIEPVIHPQSIIHSMIEFTDGSTKAQLGPPDMKVPILYSLTYPDRYPSEIPVLDWQKAMNMTFEPVDYNRFPCLRIAIDALKTGGYAPAVMNAANEVAVQRFLKKEIDYIHIPKLVARCLEIIHPDTDLSPESLSETDRETRNVAYSLFK
jgi:1-deoxy-D-xylulose-5-phosphate reductoisomerase